MMPLPSKLHIKTCYLKGYFSFGIIKVKKKKFYVWSKAQLPELDSKALFLITFQTFEHKCQGWYSPCALFKEVQ